VTDTENSLRTELATVRARLAEQERRIQLLLHSQESERRVLARELHDQAAQALAAIALGLAAVERDLSVGATRAQVEGLRARVADTLRTLRELAIELRPPVLDQLGLVPALRGLAARSATRAGHRVELEASGLRERLAPDLETTLYRLVDDLLDVLADGSGIHVSLELKGDSILITATPLASDGELILSQDRLDRIKARLDLTAGLLSVEPDGRRRLILHIPLHRPYAGELPSRAESSSALNSSSASR
jgi:signal transduction histidine kinase